MIENKNLEGRVNKYKWVPVKVIQIYDSGEARCVADVVGHELYIKFPSDIIKNLNLNVNDTFVWYPQNRNYILSSDCYKEPLPVEEIDWTEKAIEAYKRVFPLIHPDLIKND